MKTFLRQNRVSKSTLRKIERIVEKMHARQRILESKGMDRRFDHAFDWRLQ